MVPFVKAEEQGGDGAVLCIPGTIPEAKGEEIIALQAKVINFLRT